MVAHAICGSPLWRVDVQSQRSRNDAVTESVEASVAETRFDERRRAVLAVLGFDPDEPSITLGHEPRNGSSGLFLRTEAIPLRADALRRYCSLRKMISPLEALSTKENWPLSFECNSYQPFILTPMRLKGMHEEKFSFRFAVTPSCVLTITQLRLVLKGC